MPPVSAQLGIGYREGERGDLYFKVRRLGPGLAPKYSTDVLFWEGGIGGRS